MKIKKHSYRMSHLLLVEKHQQLFLKNVEVRLAREVHATAPVTQKFQAIAHAFLEVYVVEALRRLLRGSSQRPSFRPSKCVVKGTPHKP